MGYEEIIGLSITLMVMALGLLGSILPALPSTPIVLAAAIGHRLYFGAESASNSVLWILGGITVFSLLLDYFAGVLGAKKLGATWRGAVGAVVGAIVGMFFSLPGILLGPFLGALAFEWLGGRNFRESTHAGFGAMIGVVVGAVGKLACTIAMMVLFVLSVLSRT